ncbi:MAG: hypothetical protein B7Z74_10165 [Deltaproteobacteria bacterium 21-66-5]|nr:MAG: hypothetical protein B7Z74_10165 [Deltaproteobacteria bacterium 21-66-5]
MELGRDSCFIGSQYPLQVGGRDFSLDLLFFNRASNCLVAIDLKIEEFQPEHLGKLEFYLEALDRDVRKPHEEPSVGVRLCATKDNEVVEYALGRAASPAKPARSTSVALAPLRAAASAAASPAQPAPQTKTSVCKVVMG